MLAFHLGPVPAPKYLLERRFTAFPHHYTPAHNVYIHDFSETRPVYITTCSSVGDFDAVDTVLFRCYTV